MTQAGGPDRGNGFKDYESGGYGAGAQRRCA